MISPRAGFLYNLGAYKRLEFLLVARDMYGQEYLVFIVNEETGEHFVIWKDKWYSKDVQRTIEEVPC